MAPRGLTPGRQIACASGAHCLSRHKPTYFYDQRCMADAANILVVSDLHFGEELLPGASAERRRAVELGSSAFRDFLRYHTVRRRDGRPWRLVIAGDLFDFMSVVIPGTAERPAQTPHQRPVGVRRGRQTRGPPHRLNFGGPRPP